MSATYRFALPAAPIALVVGALLAWKMPNLGAQAGGDDLVTASPSPTLAPTTSPTPIPSITPTATAIPTGTPACPAATAPPGGTCQPCPTFHALQANDVGVYSTCFPSPSPTPTPTPYVSPTPCPTVSPTNCDTVPPRAGDADCSGDVNVGDVSALLGDFAGLGAANCRIFANVKCDDPLDIVDALFVLQSSAGLTPAVPAWCPPIGAMTFP